MTTPDPASRPRLRIADTPAPEQHPGGQGAGKDDNVEVTPEQAAAFAAQVSKTNSWGVPVGYKLLPGWAQDTLIAQHPSLMVTRAGFATKNLWVTAYAPYEMHPARDVPNGDRSGAGLPAWMQANRPIEDTDVVLWHTVGVTHIPRSEDWPVMPNEVASFYLIPNNFFDRSPALDVPDQSRLAARPAGARTVRQVIAPAGTERLAHARSARRRLGPGCRDRAWLLPPSAAPLAQSGCDACHGRRLADAMLLGHRLLPEIGWVAVFAVAAAAQFLTTEQTRDVRNAELGVMSLLMLAMPSMTSSTAGEMHHPRGNALTSSMSTADPSSSPLLVLFGLGVVSAKLSVAARHLVLEQGAHSRLELGMSLASVAAMSAMVLGCTA